MDRRILAAVLVGGLELSAAPLRGNPNLESRPTEDTVRVGEVVEIGLHAVSEDHTDEIAITPLVDWGRLALEMEAGWCGMQPGDTVTVLLRVSELLAPINGAQALIGHDQDLLALDDIIAGDGAGSPWDSAVVLYDEIEPGLVGAGFALFGGETDADAIVARIEFVVLPNDTPATTDVQLLAEVVPYPFITKLTLASDGSTIIPNLEGPVVLARTGDWDVDGDIDLADYSGFASCLDGPGMPDSRVDCCWFDFDRDGDGDLADFAEFACFFSGP